MNLILNRAGFRTNHEPNMVHGMVHGKFQIKSKAQISKILNLEFDIHLIFGF